MFEQGGIEATDVAVIDHYADVDRLAHGLYMGSDAILAGFGEVVRQQQKALGPQALGLLRILDGLAGCTTYARQDRYRRGACVHRCLDDLAVFAGSQGEELARTPGGEQRTRAVWGQPFQAFDVASLIEIALRSEVGDRK